MKLFSQAGSEGFRKVVLVFVLAGFTALVASAGLPQQTAVGQDLTIAPTQKPVLPWISDVVKMRDAGVPQDVIEVYVKNSKSHSTLSADDVLYLQSHGLSSGVITAMIEKSNSQAPVPAPVYVPPQSTATYAQPPAYTQQAPPYQYQPQQQPAYQSPDYGDNGSSVSVSYIGTPYYYYYYSYPYYYPYYYSWYPYYYYPYYPYYRYYPAHFHAGHDHFGFHTRGWEPTVTPHAGVNAGVGVHSFAPRMSAPTFGSPRVGFSGGGMRANFSAGGGMRMAHR